MMRGLLLALLAALGAACGSQPARHDHKGLTITITDQTFDTGGSDTLRFGRLHSGEIAVQQVWLRNESSRPAAIVACERSCGCTSLEYDMQPIAPGGELQAEAVFDSRGEQGWQFRQLTLTLAGGRQPLRIFFEAEVE